LAQQPKDNEFILLIEGNAIKFVQILIFHGLQFLQSGQILLVEGNIPRLGISFVGAFDPIGHGLFGRKATVGLGANGTAKGRGVVGKCRFAVQRARLLKLE
jgi:hypothetical protein